MSPIENMLMAALVDAKWGDLRIDDFSHETDIECDSARRISDHPYNVRRGFGNDTAYPFALYQQVVVETYRVDFLFAYAGRAVLVVECDGHEFHNATKQQVTQDRSRDRQLLLMGLPTMRFTGSELFHRADRCAVEIIRTLHLFTRHWALADELRHEAYKCGRADEAADRDRLAARKIARDGRRPGAFPIFDFIDGMAES